MFTYLIYLVINCVFAWIVIRCSFVDWTCFPGECIICDFSCDSFANVDVALYTTLEPCLMCMGVAMSFFAWQDILRSRCFRWWCDFVCVEMETDWDCFLCLSSSFYWRWHSQTGEPGPLQSLCYTTLYFWRSIMGLCQRPYREYLIVSLIHCCIALCSELIHSLCRLE